jgi:predicted DNA-binding protein (MmcQ/YjbR family)
MASTADSRLGRLRAICLELPEASEERTWDSPNWRVRKKIFAMCPDDATSVSMKADPDERRALLESDPDRCFLPSYVGSKGWIGVVLTGAVDWNEVRELVTTSYCLIAPKTLARAVAPGATA